MAECLNGEEVFTVLSIYLEPQCRQNFVSSFLKNVAKLIEDLGHNRVIWMGDFNVALNPDLDTTAKQSFCNRSVLLPFMELHELTDIWRALNPFKPHCTVRSKVGGGRTVLTRSDFFLSSPALLTGLVNAEIWNTYVADHNPITTEFFIGGPKQGKGYWKFPEFLLSDAGFKKNLKHKVSEVIQDNLDMEPGLVWDAVKLGIRGLAIDHLGKSKRERKQEIEKVEREISHVMHMRDVLGFDPYHAQFYADRAEGLQEKLNQIYDRIGEPAHIFHFAKAHYESNRCTKYYFRQLGRKNDAIKCLQNNKRETVVSTQGILNECRSFYQKLYEQPPDMVDGAIKDKFLSLIPDSALSLSGQQMLGKDISIEELYQALKQMHKEAVLGEDGFPVNFYLTFWEEIKYPLFLSFQYTFQVGHLSFTQRKGLIRLIPKKAKDPLLVSSWRPITLLNVDFKILTKLFALRLSRFLPDLIHPDQKGFIHGRSIHENLLDVDAVMTAFESTGAAGMAILLDIQKAFDSIGWKFLRSVMVKFNFPESFLQWFDIFYRGKELHVINNGFISEVIFPSRGVAQGCGISPLFFILGIKVLALAIREHNGIQGLAMGPFVKKINLLADDGMLFLKWTKTTLDSVLQVLQDFSSLSNLWFNHGKSLVIPLGSESDRKVPFENLESFQITTAGSYLYLGVHWKKGLSHRSVEEHNLDFIFEEIKTIARTHNHHSHTLLGRILNVKSLMISKFTYKQKAIPLASSAWYKKVQTFLDNYIWRFGYHHMAASQSYVPIKQGGLGMVHLLSQDKALKLSWIKIALTDQNSFWIAHLQQYLCIPLREFLSYNIKRRHLH